MKKLPAVFLDRDGVINKTFWRDGKSRSPSCVEDFSFFDGVPEAAAALRRAGFKLVVVTNQPDVARGWLTRDAVDAMNALVQKELGTDCVKACFHLDEHGCVCRKPKPGMLLEAASELKIDLQASFMVGDRYTDVEAGRAAGCRTILIGAGEGEPTCQPDWRASSLFEAAQLIVNETKRSGGET